MAHGPRYRLPFRRRREGKTNYHKRLKLLKSRKLRVVIRISNNHARVQIVESRIGGDKIITSSNSEELSKKYGWNANTGNIPAAYLTGYLAGLRAKKNNVQEAVLDLGMLYHRFRVLAAIKGFLESGIDVPYSEGFFPKDFDAKIDGSQIEIYAKSLKQNEPEKYQENFSKYIKNKVDPLKIKQNFSSTLKKIQSGA
jgi:large subunit ribosomal protein L18